MIIPGIERFEKLGRQSAFGVSPDLPLNSIEVRIKAEIT